MGAWSQVFFSQNKILDALRLVENLNAYTPDDPRWTTQHGTAEHVERLYMKYWDHAAVERLQHGLPPMAVEQPELLCFTSEAQLKDFFAEGRFFPRGWLRPTVKRIRFTKDKPISPFQSNAVGYAVPDANSFFSPEGRRNITLQGTSSYAGDHLLPAVLPKLYHEIAHANDWDTGNYPADTKIDFYWRTIQRATATDRDSAMNHDSFLNPPRNDYERWRGIMEYWADIAEKYMTNQKLADADAALVRECIAMSDQTFNPQRVYPEARTEARRITVAYLEQIVENEIAGGGLRHHDAMRASWGAFKTLYEAEDLSAVTITSTMMSILHQR